MFQGSGVATLLDHILEGYSATAFAYGPTGSGKTYSVSGRPDSIIKHALAPLSPRCSCACHPLVARPVPKLNSVPPTAGMAVVMHQMGWSCVQSSRSSKRSADCSAKACSSRSEHRASRSITRVLLTSCVSRVHPRAVRLCQSSLTPLAQLSSCTSFRTASARQRRICSASTCGRCATDPLLRTS